MTGKGAMAGGGGEGLVPTRCDWLTLDAEVFARLALFDAERAV